MASALITTSHNNVKRNINSQKHNNDLRKHPCGTNGIFWKTEDSKGSHPGADAYIPGVDPTNSRKSKGLKWQPYKVQPKSSTTSSGHVIKDVSTLPNEYAASENSTESQNTSQRLDGKNFINETRKVFLKDLCHEDKLRVANLIQELAKAGEQREKALLKLTQERDGYNKKVKELTDQVQWLSDEHKQTLCKMTDCHHLLNLYQHILIEQQQKKRRHSMPLVATNASKHNKENAKRGTKIQSNSLQLPPKQSSRAQPLSNNSCLGDNLHPAKHARRSLSPSCLQPDRLQPQFSPHSLRRSLSPRIHQPDNLSPRNCIHHRHHSPQQRRSLSPSRFPPERMNTQHPKFNSSYLLPSTNEADSHVSPQTSPCLSRDQPTNKSPLLKPRSVPESTRPNLKPATAIYKTSPSAPGMYEKTDTFIRDRSDVESLSEFPNCFQRSPTARLSCSNNSGNENNNNNNATVERIPKPSTLSSCCNERTLSPSIGFPKRNATFTNKSKTRLSLGPLQDPIMSSTQRSSELRFNGSYVSQNTASNQSCVLRSPTGSIRSLPACFLSNKDSSTNPCAPLKFETAQSDTDYSYVRKLSFSSAQSLPTALTHLEKAPHSGTGTSAAVNEAGSAAVSEVSFAGGSEEFSNPGSPIRSADDGKEIKVPDTPNTDCFRLMSNEERRQFLLEQRALLEEERNRLLAILERPDLGPAFETALSTGFPSQSPEGSTDYPLGESRPNIVQGLGGALLITNNLPLNCSDKTSNSEPILRRNKPDSLPPPSPTLPPPVYISNEVEQNFPTIDDDCCSLQSNCSFSSKQSSMSLIDLIDSIELKPPEDNKSPEHYAHQNPSQMKKISRQNIKATYPQKQELTFENQVLQDIFFLN